jgi:hypothetical protein
MMMVLIRVTMTVTTMMRISFWKTFTREVVQYMSDVVGLGKFGLPEKETIQKGTGTTVVELDFL